MRHLMLSQVICLLLSISLVACAKLPLPPTPAPARARARLLVQKQFRLGAFDFGRNGQDGSRGDSTGGSDRASLEAEALPAALLTEIRNVGRFAVYEGGNIRSQHGGTEPLNENNARDFVDGYLSGTITSESRDEVCFDLRLANAVNHEVLFVRAACTQVTADPMSIKREPLRRVAEELSRAIKQLAYGSVTSVDGQFVFVDKGTAAGVLPGMVAYLVATGDSVRDPAVHNAVKAFTGVEPSALTLAGTPVVIGEMYIVSTEEKYSVGRLFRGDYALPGDTVFFK